MTELRAQLWESMGCLTPLTCTHSWIGREDLLPDLTECLRPLSRPLSWWASLLVSVFLSLVQLLAREVPAVAE
jgi:hypothetical protein